MSASKPARPSADPAADPANSPMTRRQIRRVDQLAIDELGLPGIVLMENAGRGVVEVMRKLSPEGLGRVLIVCGKGNNGGDGYVIARHAQIWGADARVLDAFDGEPGGDAQINRTVWLASGGRLETWSDERAEALSSELGEWSPDWVIDALLGTGAKGPLREPLDTVLPMLAELPGRKLAVDIPSGLDCDTGEAQQGAFRADVTCTFVAPKQGFNRPSARTCLGELRVCDIGVPPQLIERARKGL